MPAHVHMKMRMHCKQKCLVSFFFSASTWNTFHLYAMVSIILRGRRLYQFLQKRKKKKIEMGLGKQKQVFVTMKTLVRVATQKQVRYHVGVGGHSAPPPCDGPSGKVYFFLWYKRGTRWSVGLSYISYLVKNCGFKGGSIYCV